MKKLRFLWMVLMVLPIGQASLAQSSNFVDGVGQSNTNREFFFGGGSSHDFVLAIERQFQVSWQDVVHGPKDNYISVPKLRLPLKGDTEQALSDLIELYNSLEKERPALGRLVVQGSRKRPNYVIFAQDSSGAESLRVEMDKRKVKVFSLRGFPKSEWYAIMEEIVQIQRESIGLRPAGPGTPAQTAITEGYLRLHEKTGMLVAFGRESFFEMVESLLAARSSAPGEIVPAQGVITNPSPAVPKFK